MKKMMILLLFCLITFGVNADNEFNAYQSSIDFKEGLFTDGYKYLLDNELGLWHLLSFSREELRILRNYFYAKYNYSFSSVDLISFFSKFSWYRASESNVDNRLTEIDRKNIQLIQELESNIPSDNDVGRIVGVWRYLGAVSSQGYTFGDYLIMYSNGTYEREIKNLDDRISGYIIIGGSIYGLWTTRNTSPSSRNQIYISAINRASNGLDRARINNEYWWRMSYNVLYYNLDWGDIYR
jgi:hypothetical protein